MSKHTPGPWAVMNSWPLYVVPEAQTNLSRGGSIHEDDDKRHFAVIIAEADCNEYSKFAHEIPKEEAKANARLIAAAPELLEAILNSDDAHWTPAMRSAIRKATGEQP